LKIIAEKKNITIPEIGQHIQKGISATKVRLTKLKQMGYIKRVGTLKGGHWEIIK
jgi:DNA-binding MarR family transcriptional regulator